ncbi:unnamed protein product [Lymnaea stagnalis]|uniref:G-protein coupled receptors family 1 profile domain-containing protein n=1 Tax=Lymnaea stagnalis TaxID=6523 RepID=A0AAV2H5I4_LYMST
MTTGTYIYTARQNEKNYSKNNFLNESVFPLGKWGTPFQEHAGIKPLSNFQIFEAVFLSCCLLVSTLGNGCVIWVSKHRLKRQKSASLHVLVLSLALADILQGLCQIAPMLAKIVAGEWICGEVVCKVHAVTRSMLVNISISTLAIIAMERFAYIEAFDRASSVKGYVVVMVMIWLVQCGVAAPVGVWNTVYSSPRTCNIPFDQLTRSKEYTLVIRVACYFVPLVIMWLCNVGVVYKLRASSKRVQPFTAGLANDAMRRRRSRRVTIICLMLAVIFTVNLTPFQAALIVLQESSVIDKVQFIKTMEYLWLLTVLNSCINPFVYGIFLKEFRQRLLLIITEMLFKKEKQSVKIRQLGNNVNKDVVGVSTEQSPAGSSTQPGAHSYPPGAHLVPANTIFTTKQTLSTFTNNLNVDF